MQDAFTIHCIPWEAASPLLQNVREAANSIGLINKSELHVDAVDEKSRHALALSTRGLAIGCARITPTGKIERIVVLPHKHQAKIEAAMVGVLLDYVQQGGLKLFPSANS
jgi:hypothetical protein